MHQVGGTAQPSFLAGSFWGGDSGPWNLTERSSEVPCEGTNSLFFGVGEVS